MDELPKFYHPDNHKTGHVFLDQYKIEGTINTDIGNSACYANPEVYPNFQEKLKEFKNLLIDLVNKKENKSFIRWGDGDYFVLTKQTYGSASPDPDIDNQAFISKSYEEIDHNAFLEGFIKNDYFLCEIYPNKLEMLKKIYPQIEVDYPLEYCHALVANKWLLKTFKGKLGIIASSEKINIIKQLMEYEQYQEYLGINKFEDYISCPEIHAGDDLEKTENMLAEQLKNSSSDIFLYGMGHAKLAITHRLKKHKHAIYLDVGSATQAIAGYSGIDRPYMADWIDFRMKKYDYSNPNLSKWCWENYNHGRVIHL